MLFPGSSGTIGQRSSPVLPATTRRTRGCVRDSQVVWMGGSQATEQRECVEGKVEKQVFSLSLRSSRNLEN